MISIVVEEDSAVIVGNVESRGEVLLLLSVIDLSKEKDFSRIVVRVLIDVEPVKRYKLHVSLLIMVY